MDNFWREAWVSYAPILVLLPYSLPNSSVDRSLGRILLFPGPFFVLKNKIGDPPPRPWQRHWII